MWPNPQETADLVTFTEEIVNGKLYFLCSVFFIAASDWTQIFAMKLQNNRNNFYSAFVSLSKPFKYVPPNKNMLNVSDTSTRKRQEISLKFKITMLMMSVWCFCCQLWTYFMPFPCVSITDFEQVYLCWGLTRTSRFCKNVIHIRKKTQNISIGKATENDIPAKAFVILFNVLPICSNVVFLV